MPVMQGREPLSNRRKVSPRKWARSPNCVLEMHNTALV